MIKYPVAYGVNKFGLGHFVIDRNNQYVAEVNSEKDADLLANALNAMNEFPFHAQYYDNELTDWYTKYKPIVRE